MRLVLLRAYLARRGGWIAPLLVLAWLHAAPAAEVPPDTDFSAWEPKIFAGKTRYQPVQYRGRTALQADAMGTASGLVRRTRIDLRTTPYLNWSWAVRERLAGVDEHTKAGDDYPARVYVIFSTGPFFWQTRAINYVWSSNQAPGTVWPNAFVSQSTMVAVRGPDDALGEWHSEKRNVLDDIRRLSGESVEQLEAVAIMTDTDNSGGKTRAWYGGLFFSAN